MYTDYKNKDIENVICDTTFQKQCSNTVVRKMFSCLYIVRYRIMLALNIA